MTERKKGLVEYSWGYELIWATNDKYCGKIICFTNAKARSPMQFHKDKEKTWFINAGQFMLRYIDTETAELKEMFLREGDVWVCPPLRPHQLEAMQPNSLIFEVSTPDDEKDNYKLSPGDQK